MVNTIRQLQDLKEWAQDSTRYERRLNFRLAQKPYNWEEGNWWDLDDESVGNTKILEDFEITDEMRRRPNAEGGVQQLVQPGQPGVRQGYATSKTPSKKFKYKITNQSGTVWSDTPPGGWEGDYLKMEKDPKFKEWLKTEEIDYDKIEGKHKGNIRKRFQTFLKYKDNIGIKELAEHTPFTHNTLREMIYNADKKIEKQMPYKTKSKIKNAKRVVAEMEKAGIVALDVGKKEWRYKTLNQKKIKALNNIAYGPRTFNPDTMDEMYRLFENEKFMDWVKKYDGGKIPDEIIETVYKKGNRGAYAFMQLGRVLQGKAELEGVLTNKKLGDRIVSAMIYDASQGKRGPMWGASYNYVKHDMNKYAGKNMTWDGLGDAIKKEFKEINKSLPKNSKINNIAIDEVFPIRTGSSSIGELKGADAYSNFVQFIDSEINSTKKVTFDGQSTQRAKKIIAELKKTNPDYELVKTLSETQDAEIKKFYKENPGTKGKVNLQRFPWDEKTKRFLNPKEVFEAQYKGRYDELPKKIRTGMEKFHAKHKLSIDPGKTFTMLEAQSKPNMIKMIQAAGFPIKKCLSSGGRVGLKVGGPVNECITGVINETIEKAKRGDAAAIKIFKNQKQVLKQGVKRGTGLATKLSWFLGPIDAPIELAFALPHLLMGDYEAAKRATTAGLFGWGKVDLDNVDDPEARKYMKHIRDTENWINNWQKHDYYTNKLENLSENASDAYRKQTEDRVNKFATNMESIAQNYDGYDRSGSENEDWAFNPEEMAGKKAARNWIDTKVETDLEKGLDATYRKQETPVGEIDISSYKDAAREELRASPTDLESYIKTKGQDFYGDPEGWFAYDPLKREEAEAHGIGHIYDDYYMGASEGKDIRDSYSSIPIDYASQLGALEAKETREGLEEIRERQYSSPLNKMYYAGGGIAGVRRPWAIPPASGPMPQGGGLSSQFNRVRKLTG